MTWFMLPAVVGILVKLFLLFGIRRNIFVSNALIGLISVFVLHNVSELLLFNSFVQQVDANYLIRIFYVTATIAPAYSLYYVLALGKNQPKKPILFGAGAVALSLVVLMLFTDTLVSGATALTYTITAIKGNYYWVYQSLLLMNSMAVLVCLVYNYRKSATPQEEVRNFYALASMIPLIVVVPGVVILMKLGVAINATFILPIASTAFLLILIKGKYTDTLLYDPRGFVPYSLEGQLSTLISQANAQYNFENMSHKELMTKLERAVIIYKYQKNDKNITRTAKSMQMKRTSLYGKFNQLEIKVDS